MDQAALTPQAWHRRFVQQAGWTRELRHYLYEQANLANARYILDVGCGTGALLPELEERSSGFVFGLDLSAGNLALAQETASRAALIRANALYLPFPEGIFDIVLCHFLLLWVADPAQVVNEIRRVTQPGGAVLLLAEPDYDGRIDYPVELSQLGQWQKESLHQQGADPAIGRRLSALLADAGLVEVAGGVLGGHWAGPPSLQDWETEWAVLEHDLKTTPGAVAAPDVFQEKVAELKAADQAAWDRGERVLFVPTFYAWGRVPGWRLPGSSSRHTD